jgi:hypothetical protein
MIVCDKFDEDFACIVRVRSQIDLLTKFIIHFVQHPPWDNVYIMHLISSIEKVN